MTYQLLHLYIFMNAMNVLYIDASVQHCVMGFLKKESLQAIVNAPRDSRISNSFNFRLTTIQSMPINEAGLLAKFFIAAKFNHTIPSGWPVLKIRRRVHASGLMEVFSTTMEPRPTGHLNVFEYDVRNMAFDFHHGDLIRVFWPGDTNVISRRYSLAYFRDTSNVMLSIEIGQTASTTPDDSISTSEPQTTMSVIEITTTTKYSAPDPKEGATTMMSSIDNDITSSTASADEAQSTSMSHMGTTDTPQSTRVSEASEKEAQTQVAIVIGGVLCGMAVIILLVVLAITLAFVVFRHRNHTKEFSPSFDDELKTSAVPVFDNPTYSVVDGRFH